MKPASLILFLSLLFIVPFVSAAPPITEVGHFPGGFEIKYPNDLNLMQHQDFEFEFHVFNSTNGFPVYTGISCYFHLYNSSGNHVLTFEDSISSHLFDYSFDIDGGNFSQLGQMTYILQCNSSKQGGFIDVAFEITTEGRTQKSIFDNPILLIFGAIFIILFLMAYQTKIAWLGFISSIPLILAGVYTMIYGFSGFTNLYTRGMSVIILLVGVIIMIISAFDWMGDIGGGGSEE